MNVNREAIRKKLNHGDMAEIAKKVGVSYNTVYNQFNGRTTKIRTDIADIAIEIIEKKNSIQKKFAEIVE